MGSRDEDPDHAGATHYLEHLLFKGTSKRTALEISAAMDAVGGELNAFTGKEYTCYYARILDADLPLAIDVLADMVTGSLIEQKDVDAERGVILEEIAMNEDEPSDTVHEAFAAQLFGDTPLGRPILGTVASINEITRAQIAGHYAARYTSPDLVVAVAGNVDHDAVTRQVADVFGTALTGDAAPTAPRLAVTDHGLAAGTGVRLVPRTIEQANLVLGCAGMSRTDDDRFALGVLNAALGGGMSSRLFQEVREKRGLAYSVYSFASQHSDSGMWATYIGCLPAKADEVLAICQEEIAKVISGGLTDAELDRGKGQLRGSLVLGLPGKVVRQATAEDMARIRHAAEHYVAAAREYAAGLTAPSPPSPACDGRRRTALHVRGQLRRRYGDSRRFARPGGHPGHGAGRI